MITDETRIEAICNEWRIRTTTVGTGAAARELAVALERTERSESRLAAERADLLAALKDALGTIRTWHDMTDKSPAPFKEEAWRLYNENAPEMRRLHDAISSAEGQS